MVAIGIDPGKNGGVGILVPNNKPVVAPYDDEVFIKLLNEYCWEGDEIKVCLEKVGAMPGQGVVSMFTFGRYFGFVQGVLSALRLPFQLVPPQTWKKEFSISADKNTSIAVCQRLFPGVSLLATDRCRTPHDGMAEALLMAEYARRKL